MGCNERGCVKDAVPGRKRCQPHLDYFRDYSRKWYRENKERVRSQVRSKTFGITEDEYQSLRLAQRDLCGICGEPEWVIGSHGQVKSLAIDHNHETGKVRGLLCNNCNRAVGLLKDDPGLMELAARWVRADGKV